MLKGKQRLCPRCKYGYLIYNPLINALECKVCKSSFPIELLDDAVGLLISAYETGHISKQLVRDILRKDYNWNI